MSGAARTVPIKKAIQLTALAALAAGAQAVEAPRGSADEAGALALEDELYAKMLKLKQMAAEGITEVPE
jgi:hypothetical protein